jgi:putative ABC transport system permease protein
VTVLSYALWQRCFGSDTSIVGRTIRLNGYPFTVIGVMPPDVGLFIKAAGSLVGKPAELWTPFAFTEAMRQPDGRYMSAIARLKPEAFLAEAQAQMATITAGLTKEFPQFETGWSVRLVSLQRALPGVRAAGEISYLPLTGNGAATGFTVVGQPPPEVGKVPIVDVRICDNGYFESMSVPLIEGRLFAEREMQERSGVVIINETMARLNFPGEDPIGKRLLIEMGSVSKPKPEPTEIIGVVGDVKHVDLTTEPKAMAYWPHPGIAMSAMTLTIRTESDPMAVAPLVERTIQSIDKNEPVSEVRSMEQWVSMSLAQTSFSSTLLVIFGGLALLLAAIGVYGVMSYSVTQQTSEIAVRIALGADPRAILRIVVGSGIRLDVAGLAIGLPLALMLNRTLTTLLYKTTSFDPIVFSIAISVLAAVALLASYLPARRAAHVMPSKH